MQEALLCHALDLFFFLSNHGLFWTVTVLEVRNRTLLLVYECYFCILKLSLRTLYYRIPHLLPLKCCAFIKIFLFVFLEWFQHILGIGVIRCSQWHAWKLEKNIHLGQKGLANDFATAKIIWKVFWYQIYVRSTKIGPSQKYVSDYI